MKNIHIVPTSRPSRLHEYNYLSPMGLSKEPLKWRLGRHIYITNDEEIKEGDYYYNERLNQVFQAIRKSGYNTVDKEFKVVLTTDQDLIKDGVQAIDDEFLEWFVKNSSCEEVEVAKTNKLIDNYADKDEDKWDVKYHIYLPKEEPKQDLPIVNGSYGCTIQTKKQEPINHSNTLSNSLNNKANKQETLEEVAEKAYNFEADPNFPDEIEHKEFLRIFKMGAKWQQERSYSEEEVLAFSEWFAFEVAHYGYPTNENILKALKQFKKK